MLMRSDRSKLLMRYTKNNMSKLRGVNLGGWLVLERWMTPSIFRHSQFQDEYSLASTKSGVKKIEDHRKSFIKESDFAWMAKQGINAVRIPVGYWIFDGKFDESVQEKPSIKYLDQAIRWADKYGIVVLIDMHGAQGSQNGRDHSGKVGPASWYRKREHRRATVDTLIRLAERYYTATNVWGYELLNEPKIGLFQIKLRLFYKRAMRELKKVARPGVTIVFHDAFSPRLLSGTLQGTREYPVAMDIHWYQFTDFWRRVRSRKNYFKMVARRAKMIEQISRLHPVIIGEWSAVLSKEFLDGLSVSEKRKLEKRNLHTQLRAYSGAGGWFYWSYKTEGSGSWNFRWLVEHGLITPGDIAKK